MLFGLALASGLLGAFGACPVIRGGPLALGNCTLPFTYKFDESDEGVVFDYCPTRAEALPHGGLQGSNSFEADGRWCYVAPKDWETIEGVETTYVKSRFSTNSFWGRCDPAACDSVGCDLAGSATSFHCTLPVPSSVSFHS